jgi:hypothetical protein
MEQSKYCHSITWKVIHQASNFLPTCVKFHNDDRPTIAPGTQEYGHYMLWQGIHFLWGPSGSIVTDIALNTHSSEVEL